MTSNRAITSETAPETARPSAPESAPETEPQGGAETAPQSAPQGAPGAGPKRNSYGQVIRSSALMGGSAGLNMVLGFVRTKFAAVLLGPEGIGLLANFSAVQTLVSTIAGLGLQTSAVRDISLAAAGGKDEAVGRARLSLRRMVWLSGLVGTLAMVVLSPWLSRWTFGTDSRALEMAALSAAVLLGNVSGAEMAFLQGLRRIGDLARINVIGGAIGSAASVALYAWLGLDGIVPALVATAAATLGVSWVYARRASGPRVAMTWRDSVREANSMVRLGVPLMWGAVMAGGVTYATNVLITYKLDVASVGIYRAAFMLSAFLVSFVLNAMSSDYYPRLAAAVHDPAELNTLVNEQTEVGVLLAAPALLVTLTFSPWMVRLLYSAEFLPAVVLLQWFVLGSAIRVVQWPMGFLQQALGRGRLFITTQTCLYALQLALTVFFLWRFGLKGTAFAFFALYLVGVIVIKRVAAYLTGFRWTRATFRLIVAQGALIGAVFAAEQWLPLWPATAIGVGVTAAVSLSNLRGLVARVGGDHRLIRAIRRIPGMGFVVGRA